MKKCKLCGGEFKSLEMHLTSCLKKYNITREAYNELPDPAEELSEGLDESLDEDPKLPSGVVTPVEVAENTFQPKKRDPDRPLSLALAEFEITEHEFISLLKKWKGEGAVPLEMRMNQKMKIGESIAEKVKDKNHAEVTSVEAADVLVKNYGFRCIEVRSPKGTTPKTWVLEK